MAQTTEEKAANRLRQTPLSWPELQTIILSPDVEDLAKLARSEEQKNTYRRCRAEIKTEWKSIYDYLMCTKFGFDWVWANNMDAAVDSSGGGCDDKNNKQRQKRSKPTFQEYLDEQQQREKEGSCTTQLKLSLNDFPYYFDPGVEHFVLWKLGGSVIPDEITKAKLDILKDFQLKSTTIDAEEPDCIEDGRDDSLKQIVNDHEVFLYWINPPHLKSLPGIDHVHILFHCAGISPL